MFEITLQAPAIEEIKKDLATYEKKAPQLLARVLNRTITNVKKNLTDSVRKNYLVKASDINKTLTIKKASAGNPHAQIKSIGQRILLYKFRVTPKVPKPQNPPKSYKAKVLKQSSLKSVKGGFVAQMKSGHLGIFKRLGSKKLPVKELVGPSVPQMISNKNVIKKIESEAQKTIKKRLKHEIKRIIQ